MYYTLYKTTNNINGKIYIGVHKTNNLDDGYMGSGTVFKKAVTKYGVDNFTKEVLYFFDTQDEMYEMESRLVNEDFIKNPNTYNIRLGGTGGYDYANIDGKNLYGKNGWIGYGGENLLKGNGELKSLLIRRGTYDQWCERISQSLSAKYDKPEDFHWYGKRHTEETKTKIGKANSIHQKGEGNSQYGTCWIYCPYTHQNKKIRKDDIDSWIDEGWVKGRKVNIVLLCRSSGLLQLKRNLHPERLLLMKLVYICCLGVRKWYAASLGNWNS